MLILFSLEAFSKDLKFIYYLRTPIRIWVHFILFKFPPQKSSTAFILQNIFFIQKNSFLLPIPYALLTIFAHKNK